MTADLLLNSDPVWWAEIVRGFLVGLAGIILGLAAAVVAIYFDKARETGGLLPRHVWRIALSYCLLIFATGGTQLSFLVSNEPPTWRIPFVVAAYLLGVVALREILLLVGRRRDTPQRRVTDPPRR